MEPRELRPGMPTCPSWLDELGKEKWGEIAAKLWSTGRLTEATAPLLAAYCAAISRYFAASMALRAEGMTIKYPSGYQRAHPMVKAEHQAFDEMLRLATKLGLTPKAGRK